MSASKAINCVILRCQSNYFLLPELLVQDIFLFKMLQSGCQQDLSGLLTIHQGQSSYPILDLHFAPIASESLHPRSKIALINTSTKTIATPFEGIPHKIEIQPEDLTWFDVEQRIAMLGSCEQSALKVVIPVIG